MATNARADFLRGPHHRRMERLGPSRRRSSSKRSVRGLSYLRSDVMDRFAKLRAELDHDEQILLLLRVEKEMSWPELAEVLSGQEPLDEQELRSRAAALRQRFKRLKDKIRKIASEEGLLERA